MGQKRRLRERDGDPEHQAKVRLRRAFALAKNFYWCNTDRGATPDRNALEEQMHGRRFAAAWVDFVYESHMRRARRGDLIFMYANDVGVVAVGVVKENRVEILGPDHPDRLRECAHGEHDEEWRIPVRWLVWDDSAPCPIPKPLRGTFLQLKSDGARLKKIRRHFVQ